MPLANASQSVLLVVDPDLDPLDAACTGVYLHGLAGDILQETFGDTGLAAMDLAERIPAAIQRVRTS